MKKSGVLKYPFFLLLAAMLVTCACEQQKRGTPALPLDPEESVPAKPGTMPEPGVRLYFNAKTLDGAPLDMASMRGKVVLLDFWATWCRPCVAEVPNVKKMYEKYHDKGFEVVAISVDSDREDLAAFLKAKNAPWMNVHNDDTDMDGMKMDAFCDVQSIPCMILLDRSGRVISTNARGSELQRLLGEMFSE